MKSIILCTLFFLFFAFINTVALAKNSSYCIGPGDILEISVWKDESLTKHVIVPPDGVISFPLIDDIDVTGLTVPELKKIITTKLSEYVPDATVAVMLIKTDSMMAYVLGKVNKPGAFPIITMETNVMQLLAMAGGLNPYASSSNILILRQQDNTTMKIPFNYKHVEKGKNLEQNILIQRGDVLVVP